MNLLTGTFQDLFTWESRNHEKSNILNNVSICRFSTMYFDVGSLILKDLMMLFPLCCYLHQRVLTFSPIPLLRFWGLMTVASKEIHQETQWEASHCGARRRRWIVHGSQSENSDQGIQKWCLRTTPQGRGEGESGRTWNRVRIPKNRVLVRTRCSEEVWEDWLIDFYWWLLFLWNSTMQKKPEESYLWDHWVSPPWGRQADPVTEASGAETPGSTLVFSSPLLLMLAGSPRFPVFVQD